MSETDEGTNDDEEILGDFVGVRWIDGEIILSLAAGSGAQIQVVSRTLCPNLEGFLEVLGIYAGAAPLAARRIKRNCINGCHMKCQQFPDACERKLLLDRKLNTAFEV